MKKVAAFTIIEVTIAMLISALVIGMTYSIYLIVSKSYQSFNLKNDTMAVVLRLDEWLHKDFDRSEAVWKDTSGIAMQYPGNTVRYKFDTAYVVRIGVRTDTFKVKTDTVNTLFEGKAISEFKSAGDQNRIDQLDLSLILQNQKITYHYHKVYSSANLINRNPDALN